MDDYAGHPAFTSQERLCLAFCDAMCQTPVQVEEALFEALSQHFSEPQIVEMTAVIAWENYRARFNHALGVESQNFCSLQPSRPRPAGQPAPEPGPRAAGEMVT